MKHLSTAVSRSTWLGHVNDLNPNGKYIYPELLTLFLNLYKFKKYPSPQEALENKKETAFEGGEYQNTKGNVIAIKLSIINYGVEVETTGSTEDADEFIEHALKNICNHFKLLSYDEIFTDREYLSQIYVNTDVSLDLINPKLKAVSEYLSNNITGYGEVNYEVGGVTFAADQINRVNPLPFSIERAAGVPLSENRYLSTSSLQTKKHLEVLEILENLLSG